MGAFVSSGFLSALGTSSYTVPVIMLSGFPSMTADTGDGYEWFVNAVYGTPAHLAESAAYLADELLSVAQNHNAQSVRSQRIAGRVLSDGQRAFTSAVHTLSNATPTSGDGYWAAAEDCYSVGGSEGC